MAAIRGGSKRGVQSVSGLGLMVMAVVLLAAWLGACSEEVAGPGKDEAISDLAPAFAAASDTADGLITTTSGLQYSVLQRGEGGFPLSGAWVTVHYVGTLEDGTVFDSSRRRDSPLIFRLGLGRVIPGWDEGIALMRLGDTIRLVVPAELAYGSSGAGPIPPDATLIFEIELLKVESP
jgi:FKBP-type peptidyl-prolyl cis-trans isomerase